MDARVRIGSLGTLAACLSLLPGRTSIKEKVCWRACASVVSSRSWSPSSRSRARLPTHRPEGRPAVPRQAGHLGRAEFLSASNLGPAGAGTRRPHERRRLLDGRILQAGRAPRERSRQEAVQERNTRGRVRRRLVRRAHVPVLASGATAVKRVSRRQSSSSASFRARVCS